MLSKSKKALHRLKTISLFGVGQAIPMVAQLIISLLIIKYHSKDLWGEYVELLLWVNFLAIFFYFGNKSYLLKAISENPAKLNRIWGASFVTRALLFTILLLFIWWFPLFAPYKIKISLWAFLLFYNQSFEVLVLYQRDFKFNLIAELVRNIFIVAAILFFISALEIADFLIFIVIALAIKALFYTVFYFKNLSNVSLSLDTQSLKNSFPFFIPMLIGTIRTRIDSYYGTIFFSKATLSEYQIFVNFLMLIQMGVMYAINPYLKTLYRISNETRMYIEKKSFSAGLLIGIVLIPLVFIVINYVYHFSFSILSYTLAFLFVITLCVQILLITELYKENKQMQVAGLVFSVAVLQIVLGYYVIPEYQTEGALAIKTLGQWSIVLLLLGYRKRMMNKRSKSFMNS